MGRHGQRDTAADRGTPRSPATLRCRLLGLAIAFIGVLLHHLTGSPTYDSIGSILVGVLLGVVAVILINQNRRFLLGQAVDDATRTQVLRKLLSHSEIDRVTYLHVEFTGPALLFLVAAVDFVGDEVESSVAVALRELEALLKLIRGSPTPS